MLYTAINICPNLDSGLCNQLYSLIGYICYCINNNINILFIDKFYKSVQTNYYCDISNILNINFINKYLSKYNIFLVDSKNFIFNIDCVSLFNKNNIKIHDITNEITNQFLQNNNFSIYSDTPLNFIINNDEYFLKIKYKINDGFFEEMYTIKNKKLTTNILYNFNELFYNIYPVIGYKSDIFWDILKNIEFIEEFTNTANFIKTNINHDEILKINCIHLRIENDFISHYSKAFSVNENIIKNAIEYQFIKMIKEKINKNELTIVLTGDLNNNVIDYLINNNYLFRTIPKLYNHRELNAIIDLEVGLMCNNTLIIVFESSFSYTLMNKIKHDVKKYQLSYEAIISNI